MRKAERCKAGRETWLLLDMLSQRMISDFEIETRDFAMLCLIASANGLKDWPPQNKREDEDSPGYLTFH